MKRDVRIDILRAIAITLIVLAHVFPPTNIFRLRMFDVPLMTMVLGMSYKLSSSRNINESYVTYCLKRFKRLILPAWLFVVVYLILLHFLKNDSVITTNYILNSFKMARVVNSMPYVWIIRVFLIISLISPFLNFISNIFKKISLKIILLFILLFIQRISVILFLENSKSPLFENLSMYFSYSLIALVGMWVIKQSIKENLIMVGTLFTLFLILVNKKGFSILGDKYPPGLLYSCYGMLVSITLFIIFSNSYIMKNNNLYIAKWLSKNSLQLYYYHALVVTFISPSILGEDWIRKWVLVFSISVILVYIQNYVLFTFKNSPLHIPKIE